MNAQEEMAVTPNELFTEWLEALRSGEYKQGTCYLNNDGKYCCLGVLCDIASKHRVVEKGVSETQTIYFSKGDLSYAYDQSLPESLVYFLGFMDDSGYFGEDHELEVGYLNALSSLNDSGKYTFPQIADFIEENKNLIVTKVTI